MAHTGVKRLSMQAMNHAATAGATVLSVGSLTAEHPGSELILRTVEREKSAAYTTSHLAAMTVLAQVATVVDEQHGTGGNRFREALERLPDQVAAVIAREDEIVPVAEMAATKRIYATAAGPNEATVLELTIKAREAAYAWVDGLALEQFLHGPAVAVNAGDLAVLVHVPGAASARTQEIAAVVARMGTALWIAGDAAGAVPGATRFPLPGLTEMPEVLTPLLTVVPMQILAYRLAVVRGTHPDTFRRDDPVYKEAFGQLTL
jgi:glucosamine--fructose-6-phosphate aminotransferase (isomerizing)